MLCFPSFKVPFVFPFFASSTSVLTVIYTTFVLSKTVAISHTNKTKTVAFLPKGDFPKQKKHNYQITEMELQSLWSRRGLWRWPPRREDHREKAWPPSGRWPKARRTDFPPGWRPALLHTPLHSRSVLSGDHTGRRNSMINGC